MNTFFDLCTRISQGPESRTDPTWADRQFPGLIANSPFRLWRLGDPIPAEGERLLIGVATWSGYDMRFLDVIAEAMGRGATPGVVVEVFNVAECQQPGDFQAYIPGLPTVHHTPVAGFWRDGRLEWSGVGHVAKDRVVRLFGSSSDEIDRYVTDWREARLRAQEEELAAHAPRRPPA